MSTDRRMLFVAPPWIAPNTSSLALGTLCPILRAAGIEVDELHGSTFFPPNANDFSLMIMLSRFLFVPALTGCELEPLLDRMVQLRLDDACLYGLLVPDGPADLAQFGIDPVKYKANLRRDFASAEVCLERMLERALAHPYDIVALSATFDQQVPAALVLARELKRRRPGIKVVIGGAACFEEQADGLIASFPDLDAACHAEGEDVIIPLIEALRGKGGLADVPGITWRDGAELRHNPPPTLLRELDRLPVPDFRPFMEQYAASPYAKAFPPRLMFETSRGCWWGQKNWCTFCGLNGGGIQFRSKSPERAYDEIAALYRDYPAATYLQSTDNIVDLKYLSTVFPRLADLPRDPDRPLSMFYECKTNMKPEQVAVMAAAGITEVQPGIESFSDGVLKLMRKGCTALGQVQFIKWCQQFGITPLYNILLCNPGDQTEWYRDMLALVPYLRHLQPPVGIVVTMLERFSPYWQHPEEHGISNVRARDYYKAIYPGHEAELDRLAYQFDYDHPMHHDEELRAATRACFVEMQAWCQTWTADTLYYEDLGARLVMSDRRHGDVAVSSIAGVAAQIYLYLDTHRSRRQIAEEFPQLDATFVDTLLLAWLHRLWICRAGDRYLAVAPRKGPAAVRSKTAPAARRPVLKLVEASAS